MKSPIIRISTGSVTLCSLALALPLQAATVIWSTPTAIADSAEVNITGTTVLAVHAKYNGAAETVNGVTFHPTPQAGGFATPYTVGAVSFTAVNDTSAAGASLNGTAPFLGSKQLSGADADPYERTISNAFEVNGAAGGTVTLSGLTIDQEYLVQFWAADFRQYTNDRGITISGSAELEFLGGNGSSPSSGRGNFITGTFTADAATQVFSIDVAGVDNVAQFNAFQLRAIPEPAAALLSGLGLLGLLRRRRA